MRKLKGSFMNYGEMLTFKVEAQGDTIYIQAPTKADAELKFVEAFGKVPKKLLTWTQIDAIPDGEEAI
jgi:hypothetical protein